MPKGFSEHEKKIIRERLLDEGYRQFAAYGLKKTNVDELAEAAGISKGAFYIFYESKEALFMDVVERTEQRVRRQLFALVDQPGPSPRERFYALLKKAFDLFTETPILQFFSGTDYELLLRRIPGKKLQDHLASDQAFIRDLVSRCQEAGIPIQVAPEQIVGLLYPLVLAILHRGDLGLESFDGSIDVHLELVAAYCLGEIETLAKLPAAGSPGGEGKGL
ncbi:MAG TPA: TetR/AcrR family transcriptional regulator [Anaerolineaceae bacterium]|nr:TetR/AcrR family transcriptional regulator [Anaerolineaceae bacterium]